MAESSTLPGWDLKFLYRSESDPQIAVDLQVAFKKAKSFGKKYRGKLSRIFRSVRRVQEVLIEYEAIQVAILKPYYFSSLRQTESTTDPKRGAFKKKMERKYLEVQKELTFFELEILSLDTKRIRAISKHTDLKQYRHYFQTLQQGKTHRLSEREEQIFQDKSLTGRSAFIRLYEMELGELEVQIRKGKQKKKLPFEEALSNLYSSDRKLRKVTAAGVTEALKQKSKRLAYIHNTLILDKSINDSYRKFSGPEDSRHLSNEIDAKMVQVMADVVSSNNSLVQRYYRLKRKMMGVSKLYDYDRYAPVFSNQKKISYSQAQSLVVNAFQRFDQDFGEMAQEFFDRKWIHVAPTPGKRGGAFCAAVTPDLHPVVLINYTRTMKDVFTLAHELGHGIHYCLMKSQNYLNYRSPLTIAETASEFAEMILFEELKEKFPAEDLLPLYMSKVENIFATVFRQIAMYRFEQDLHSAREDGELAVSDMNRFWKKRHGEMFGRSLTLTEDHDYWWEYVMHFVHTPFYVYAYAFGELLTFGLYDQYLREGDVFIRKYKNFLNTSGAKSPKELVRPFKINLAQRTFWKRGIKTVERLVDETEKLYRSL